ncbi:tRNA modification GTPase MnmE [Burkholderiales bacterium]|nr:tRNA modification GTPase MnmE [Burkholderiales bacterium]
MKAAPTDRDPDTIAAIATPPGRGGIGIVRVSGAARRVEAIVSGVVGRTLEPRVATYATFRGTLGEPIDRGLAILFAAPASTTGETVAEFQGHGSPAAMRLVLARCLELGARLAEPGEFTKRAFINGKLDLAQAESVADLIDAASATAARAAARSLAGEFSREVRAIVDAVTELRMFTEATLDFPDEDIEFVRASDASGRLARLRASLDALLARAATGARLNAGLAVVLVGRPNVGKSSLMNRLARDDVAIVAAVPGTTRDTVERAVEIGGIPLTVVDTAGLRATGDTVERLGIARTWAAVERADLALVLVDARESGDGLHDEDRAILAELPAGLPHIVVHNKADLAGREPRTDRGAGTGARAHVWLSALTGAGVDLLEGEVLSIAGVDSAGEDAFIARERHLAALHAAAARLRAAAELLALDRPPLELYAEELREAQNALASITGAFTADDLLGVIFSRFCIGK